MPIRLQPAVTPRYSTPSSGVFTSGDWGWLAKQEYDPDAAWKQIGNERRGTVKGGPTYTRLLQLGDEREWAVIPPRPALNEGVLDHEREFYRRQLGAIDLNLADPITTMRSIADQSGMAMGEDQNPLSWLRNVDAFLQTKDIDPFGMEDTGAPARAADYALALPILVWNHLSGRDDFAKDPNGVADFSYRFQADPRYWRILANKDTTDEDLDTIARAMVGQFADPDRNSYLVEQIRKQMNQDKLASEAMTSGNDAIDYAAIKTTYARAAGIPFYKGQGWTPIPVIGTQIASSIDPITREEREWWESLTIDERATALQDAGMQQMAKDFVGSVPALSGLGTVLMVAKAGQLGTAGRALYQTYDWGFRGANVVMTTGLVVATANWAAQAYWPDNADVQAIGREIDLTRPISQSMLAGAVNATGYWATGTYGGWNLVKGGTRVIRTATSKGLPVLSKVRPSPIGGTGPELELYRVGHGGARMAGRLVSEGLDAQGLALSQKRLTLSYVSHLVRRHDEEMFSAIVEGQPTGIDAIDELPLNERIEFANAYMANSVDANAARTEMAFRILNMANQPDDLFKSLDDIRVRDWAKKNARTIEHLSAGAYLSEYGPAFIYRTTGGNDAASIEAWVRESFARMGIPDHRLGSRSLEEWEQTLRAVYQYEFDRNVGLMHAATDAMPTNEAGMISLVSSRHVFKDEIEDLVAVLRGEDEEAARALVVSLIRDKIEVEQWYTRHWQPPRKSRLSPELVDPKALAKHLEEIEPALPSRRGNPNVDPEAASLPLNSFHRQLQEDGIWEIAFKPTDENGNFVSYVRTSDGASFRSPWLDYPMTSTDMVELGNAGLLRSKWDSVFRGFRTYRISEFQRGSLFRSLTGNFDFTASQIDEFHDRIVRQARESNVQPQTLGTVGKINVAGAGSFKGDVERIAADVFGDGPWVNRRGEEVDIDWLDVVAKSYRQSLKLNLTAGLTSHLKSRLGTIGNGAAWASDIAYVNIRFNLSPIFKWSEFVESLGFGAMRGNARGDPWTEALFYRYGLGNDFGIVSAEKTYDQMLAGMNEVGRGGQRVELTPAQRQAKGYMWYARNLPEDFQAQAERSMVEEEAAEFAAAHGGGQAIRPTYPREEGARAGFIEDMPGTFTMDPVLAGVPADRLTDDVPGFWHTTTNIDAVMQEGLFSRSELAERNVDSRIRAEVDRELSELSDEMNMVENEIANVGFSSDEAKALDTKYWELKHRYDALWERRQQLNEPPIGLGNLIMDNNVSVTVSEAHAITIAERLRLAVRAARNEADVDEIVEHFTQSGSPYDLPDATVMSRMTDGTGSHTEWEPYLEELRLRYNTGSLKYNLVQQLDRGLHRLGIDDDGWSGAVGLVGEAKDIARIDPRRIGTVRVGVRSAPPKAAKLQEWLLSDNYQASIVDAITRDPRFDDIDLSEFTALRHRWLELNTEGQAAGWKVPPNHINEMERISKEALAAAVKIDEAIDQLTGGEGLLLVDPGRGSIVKEGPDVFEYQFRSADTFVIDDRPNFPIAYGDRDELLKQLRQSITERPQPNMQERLENELGELVSDTGEFLPGMEARGNEIIDELARLDRREAVEQADRMEDVFGTPEHLEQLVQERTLRLIPDWKAKLAAEGRSGRDVVNALLPNPIPFKERAASRTQIDIMRREFPSLLRAAGMDGPIEVFQQLGIPEREWAAFLLRDRELLMAAQTSNHPDDWAALFDWAPGQREELDALYASEEWSVITSLWSIASRTASDEAFRIHFFNPYRSVFERSINHPLLGVYPASWAYKAAREWVKFLFDNDTFAGLHLGMTPVVAINNLVDAQNQAFAQANPEQLEYYVNRRGPFGSTLFIFNLLMPGDWSSIPFPLSRSIRDILRGNTDPGYILQQQAAGMGFFRDVRLTTEMLGEVEEYTFGPDGFSVDNPWTPKSEQLLYSEPRR